MTIEQLKYFCTIVKYQSFSVAAEECYISQSSLSKQIQALEKELQTKLFIRSTRAIRLTETGKAFLEHAERILGEYDNLILDIQSVSRAEGQSLILGMIPVMSNYGFLNTYLSLRRNFPKMNFQILERDSTEIFKALKRDEIDFAILREDEVPLSEHELSVWHLFCDELVVLAPKNYCVDKDANGRVDLKYFSQEDFLFLNSNTGLFRICVRACERAGFSPKILPLELRLHTLLDLVENEAGISLIIEGMIPKERVDQLQIIKLKQRIEINFCIVAKKEKVYKDIHKMFLEYIRDTFNQDLDENLTE